MAGSEETCIPTFQEEFQLREMGLNPRQVYTALKDLFVNGYENKALLVFL